MSAHPRYLLDTNICIYIAKASPPHLLERFKTTALGEVAMSVVTYGELEFGARKSKQSKTSLAILAQLPAIIPILPIDTAVGQEYGRIRAELEAKGQPIGGNDLWIAAHASAIKATLVTNNMREFARVSGLVVQDWSR